MPLGRDQTHPGAAALQERVGADRGPEREPRRAAEHGFGGESEPLGHEVERVEHALSRNRAAWREPWRSRCARCRR